MALLAQKCWRGYISRKQTRAMRAEELVFIGMAPPPDLAPEDDPQVKEAGGQGAAQADPGAARAGVSRRPGEAKGRGVHDGGSRT